MDKLTDCYRLSNGVEIPCIGFGTWQTPDGTVAEEAVKAAIAAGLSGREHTECPVVLL